MTDLLETLYDYQSEDVDKLTQVEADLIGSEMGTGKTLEAMAKNKVRTEEQTHHQAPRTLIVAPLSVLASWERHYDIYLPDRKVRRIDPKNRNALLADHDPDIYLVHWEALRLMPDLQKVIWTEIIADEGHRAKNRKAQQTKALKRLRAPFKSILTGTPVVNRPDEMWSLLNFLYPRQFTSYWKFWNAYVEWEWDKTQQYRQVVGPKNEDHLLKLMRPFYVRHLKKDPCCAHHPQGVNPWLPDKTYSQVWVDLTAGQRRAYEAMKREMIAWVGAQEATPLVAPVVVAQLTRLQQFALASADVVDGSVVLTQPSAKLDALMQIIQDNPTEQIVVFSQFTKMTSLVVNEFKKKGVTYVEYTGKQSAVARDQAVRDFTEGRAQIFIGSIGAGGVGIDGLQGASATVVFLDRSWSPAINQQAEDRIHRVGQDRPVQVIDIMARDTVDLGRHQRLEMKWSWIRRMLGDQAAALAYA